MEAFKFNDFNVRVQGNGADFRTKEAGGMTMAWVKLDKGVNFAPALNGLPDDNCQCPHWGYILKGKLLMRTPSGDKTYEAGQAVYWGPGHAPEALEDTEYIDVSPTKELEEVIAHVTGGG